MTKGEAQEMSSFGYAGKVLTVDLSSGKIVAIPTRDYADRFLGGRGMAAKAYWDRVPPDVDALDPQNILAIATGPLCGLPIISSSRWVVCAKTPAKVPNQFSYCNLGGTWGAELRFAGYDGMVVQGRSEKPVYLFLHDDTVEIRDATALWGKGAIDTREILKSQLGNPAKILTIGQAGENMATMAILLADNDAAGSGGLGAVMGSKKLKAIVVRGSGKRVSVAQPERLRDLSNRFREVKRVRLKFSPISYSRDPLTDVKPSPVARMKMDRCYGCFFGCARAIYEAQDGTKGKFTCHAGQFYQPRAESYYGEWNDVPFQATRLCNNYGVDTKSIDLIMSWLAACHKAGIMSDENTGIPISKLGSLEFIETLVRKVALREGFGDILAQGLTGAADSMGPAAKEQLKFTGFFLEPGFDDFYSPRLYITNALLYAMDPRRPIQQIHEVGLMVPKWVAWTRKVKGGVLSTDSLCAIARRFWGSELAADFSTYDGKALAAKMIQDRSYAKECLVLCDRWWPILDLQDSENHVGDPTLESQILSSVTGDEIDETGLNRIGERVFNLQRAISVRERKGGREFDKLPDSWHTVPIEYEQSNIDCLVPGKGGEIISRKGAVVDRDKFEKMKDEYYELRGWDVGSGLQTKGRLEDLGLKDIAEELERSGFTR